MKELRAGDIVTYWEKNKYGYNILHRGEVKMNFASDKIAYIENLKSHIEYVIEHKNIDTILTQ